MLLNSIRKKYEHTIYACYIGYITQAIVNNFAPLLFLTFAASYHLSLDKITLITTVNFLVQLSVDLLSAKVIDRVGYRVSIIFAHITAAAGLVLLAVLPEILDNAYAGILLAVVLYAIGGGIIEVLISPIVEACPTKKKEAAMSLLHSFYCWGHLAVVLLSSLFFFTVGIEHWRILAVLWAIIPILNSFYFRFVPIYEIVQEHEKMSIGSLLSNKVFWLIVVLMICAGASELAMSQWVSAFAESGIHVSKTVGDLAGPSAFAFLMGSARALYGKYSDRLPLKRTMAFCAVLCICCYMIAVFAGSPILALIGCSLCGFSVGIFWPGTFSLAAIKLPAGGTTMYALLALAGDFGCSSGPTVVGLVSNSCGGLLSRGLFAASIFPLVMLLGILLLKENRK